MRPFQVDSSFSFSIIAYIYYFRFFVIIEIADRVETMIAVISAKVCSHGFISAGTMLRNIPAIGAPMPYRNLVPRSV
jgi:hypothetical protein